MRADTPALATALIECAGTDVLNLDDEEVRAADRLSRMLGSIALSSETVDGELHLTLYTEISAFAQSGVTTDRVTLGTCWQVTVDESGRLGEPTGTSCSEALIARVHPTDVLDFDEVDVTLPAPSD